MPHQKGASGEKMEEVIKTQQLMKYYSKTKETEPALAGVDLTVKPGEL